MDVLECDMYILKLCQWFSNLCYQFDLCYLTYFEAENMKNNILDTLSHHSTNEAEVLRKQQIAETLLFELNNAEIIQEEIFESKIDISYSFLYDRYLFNNLKHTGENDLPYIYLVVRTLTNKIEELYELIQNLDECLLNTSQLISDFWSIT